MSEKPDIVRVKVMKAEQFGMVERVREGCKAGEGICLWKERIAQFRKNILTVTILTKNCGKI